MSALRTVLLCVWLTALPGQSELASNATNHAPVSGPSYARLEQVRSACIAGRRRVCGRVLQVTLSGLIVDSGYPSLLEPPFNHSWVTRSTANPARPAALVEGTAPDSIAVGLVFLTDIPKRQKVHQYDYVALIGYPAGHDDYVPAPGVQKRIRRFAAGLERAVTLTIQAGEH
jgi:hypothetical protein